MHINELKKLSLHPGSHKMVDVECDFAITKKCKGKYKLQYRKALKWAKNNKGRVICMYCSHALKFSGRNNPNTKYQTIDDNFFYTIDTEFKAYMLGWIASDGHIATNKISIVIQIHEKDKLLLQQLRDGFCKELPIKEYKDKKQVALAIHSTKIHADIRNILRLENGGKKSNIIEFPKLENEKLQWSFLRGYFDGDGCVTLTSARFPGPRAIIVSTSIVMLNQIKQIVNIPCSISKEQIAWSGVSALDFLGKLYENASIFLLRKRNKYLTLATWQPCLAGTGTYGKINNSLIWAKTDKEAVPPSKIRVSDSGYDLTIIKKVKQLGMVEFYDTGIKVQPPFGYYFDLVPRSSLAKTGYMLVNSIGVIDRSYVGSIMVPLLRIDHTFPPIELPSKVVQLIPRPIVHFELNEVDILSETARGSGGFGSTDKPKY